MKRMTMGIAAVSALVLALGLPVASVQAGEAAVQEATLANDIAQKALDVARAAVVDAENRLEAAIAAADNVEIRDARAKLRKFLSGLRRAERMADQVADMLERTQDAAQRAADADTDRQREAALAAARVAASRATRVAEQMRKMWLDPDAEYVEDEVLTTTTTTTTTTQADPVTRVPVVVKPSPIIRTRTDVVPVTPPTPTPVGALL